MQRGTVVYYNSAEGKKFGFIKPSYAPNDNREHNVFFHLTRQRIFICDGSDEPAIIWGAAPVEPIKGDQVIFEDVAGAKGLQAVWWGFEEEWDQAHRDINNRPTYRLRERTGLKPLSRLSEKPEYRTRWQGENLAELRKLWNKEWYPVKDGETLGRWFEKWDEVIQTWEPCEDPR